MKTPKLNKSLSSDLIEKLSPLLVNWAFFSGKWEKSQDLEEVAKLLQMYWLLNAFRECARNVFQGSVV